jgi:tryptophanyl-tRNA synthetase
MKDAGFESFGHFECALENGVRLRNEYDCFFLIADYQLSDLSNDLPRATPSGR